MERVVVARRRLIGALRRSADVHDDAAAIFDRTGRRDRSVWHRDAAVADRRLADDVERNVEVR